MNEENEGRERAGHGGLNTIKPTRRSTPREEQPIFPNYSILRTPFTILNRTQDKNHTAPLDGDRQREQSWRTTLIWPIKP